MLSSFLAMSQQGHLQQVMHIFAYLETRHNSRMVLNPTYLVIDETQFKAECDWKPLYGGTVETIPRNAPEAQGKCIVLHMYVDADHVGNTVTCRSQTGCIIAVNNVSINWYSKK
jgi:hypothetical protein